MADEKPLDSVVKKHEPVDVSKALREATAEPAERVFPPTDKHVVSKIVKRESGPAE